VAVELTLGGAILAALVLYALSGGADYGGGMWDLLASGPRARRQREAIEHAIGPIWEANHIWLILVIVVLFTGFPPAFAVIMTALHLPMTAILVGIVLRGSAFVFRRYDARDDAVHRRWSTLFGAASFFTPFVLGLSLGALASGEIRVVDGRLASGFFAGWTRPFAVACGLFAQGLFAFLAAAYLTVDTESEPDLQEDFRKRALASGLFLAPVAALTFILARETDELVGAAPGGGDQRVRDRGARGLVVSAFPLGAGGRGRSGDLHPGRLGVGAATLHRGPRFHARQHGDRSVHAAAFEVGAGRRRRRAPSVVRLSLLRLQATYAAVTSSFTRWATDSGRPAPAVCQGGSDRVSQTEA